jgi:hypothetical protein
LKSPTGEEIRRAFKPDRQLGGGVLPIQTKRLWEEEIVVSLSMFYQKLQNDKQQISHCSNAFM